MWNPKVSEKCLKTFSYSEDYIYDVKWNPVNPTMFASANGEGFIDIWDLSKEF